MARGRRIKPGRRILFALIVMLLLFPLAEIVLRIADVSVDTGGPMYLDRLFYQEIGQGPAGWDEYITLGAKVYPLTPRNYNIPREIDPKPAGVTRIVCLGDSCTIGDQVRPDQPYPQILARLLPQCFPDRNVQVWNLGRHGYSSYQGRILIEQLWDLVQPDVLVFYFGANDASPAPIRADKDWARVSAGSLKTHRYLYTRSVLYRLLRNVNVAYLQRRGKRAMGGGDPSFQPLFRVGREDFFANRQVLTQRVGADGGYLLTISAAGLTHEQVVPGQYYDDWLPGAHDLDLAALFGPEYAAGRKTFADVVHPNPYGHRLIARALIEKLAAQWGAPQCDLLAALTREAGRDAAPPG